MRCRSTTSARASGRATSSFCTKSPTAPPTAATALPSPSSPGLPPTVVARARSVLAEARSGPRRDRRDRGGPRRPAAVRGQRRAGAGARSAAAGARRARSRQPDPARGARGPVSPQAAGGRARLMSLHPTSTSAARSSTGARSPIGLQALRAARSSRPKPRRSCAERSSMAAPKSRGASREEPGNGRAAAQATAFLHDQLVRLAYDFVTERLLDGRSRSRWRWSASAARAAARWRRSAISISCSSPPRRRRRSRNALSEAMLHMLWDLKLKVGHSVRSIAAADRPREEGHDHPHRLPRGALAVGRREAVRRRHAPLPQGGRRRHGRRVRHRQARRARRAARQDGRQPLRRRTQRQGRQGRPSRPPHALLDRQICPRRRAAGRPRRRRPADRRRVPPLRPRRALLLVGALPPAPACRPRRGAAQLRLSAAHRRDHALRRPAREIRGRALHAILLPQREDGR